MYKLENTFTQHKYTITIVGCGGTGAFVADGLCRLLPRTGTRLVLIDHDTVEERNLARQNFFREDLGKFKSEVVAHRLARLYGLPVGYATSPLQLTEICYPGIIVGCVDNGKARNDIAKRLALRGALDIFSVQTYGDTRYKTVLWWVDAGNGENYGQVLIGNSKIGKLDKTFLEDVLVCQALPLPTIQSPDLLAQAPPARDCVEIAEQEPVINRFMASLTLEVVRRIINGTCSWMQLWVDLEAGSMTPVLATPENVAAMSKKKAKRLIRKEDK